MTEKHVLSLMTAHPEKPDFFVTHGCITSIIKGDFLQADYLLRRCQFLSEAKIEISVPILLQNWGEGGEWWSQRFQV